MKIYYAVKKMYFHFSKLTAIMKLEHDINSKKSHQYYSPRKSFNT